MSISFLPSKVFIDIFYVYFSQEMVEAAGDDEKELAAQMAAEFLNEDLSEQQFGAPKAGPGMWASILRMLDPIKVLKDGTWEELAYS